jgi:hypothetical protein
MLKLDAIDAAEVLVWLGIVATESNLAVKFGCVFELWSLKLIAFLSLFKLIVARIGTEPPTKILE